MFVVSQLILNKNKMCLPDNVPTYSVALGLAAYACVYVYLLLYSPTQLEIFHSLIFYIVTGDLFLSMILHYFSATQRTQVVHNTNAMDLEHSDFDVEMDTEASDTEYTESEDQDNVEDDVTHNVEDDVEDDVTHNVEHDITHNVEHDIEHDVEYNVEQNMEQNMEHNVEQNVEQNTQTFEGTGNTIENVLDVPSVREVKKRRTKAKALNV